MTFLSAGSVLRLRWDKGGELLLKLLMMLSFLQFVECIERCDLVSQCRIVEDRVTEVFNARAETDYSLAEMNKLLE